MVSLVFFNILQLPHTVISNYEKLIHPNAHINTQKCGVKSWGVCTVVFLYILFVCFTSCSRYNCGIYKKI